jgi:hypothetical protein
MKKSRQFTYTLQQQTHMQGTPLARTDPISRKEKEEAPIPFWEGKDCEGRGGEEPNSEQSRGIATSPGEEVGGDGGEGEGGVHGEAGRAGGEIRRYGALPWFGCVLLVCRVPVRGALHFGLIANNFKAEMLEKIGGFLAHVPAGTFALRLPVRFTFFRERWPAGHGGHLAYF